MKLRKLVLATSLVLATTSAYATDVKFSGFVNLVGQAVDRGDGTEYDFNDLTKVGVQADIKVNDRVSATFQAVNRQNEWTVSSGDADRETTMEYGFVAYKATDALTLRAGRLRSPFFLLSEYVEVGSVIPWNKAPTAVYYQLPNNAHDGIDLLYSGEFGETSYTTQLFYGNSGAGVHLKAGFGSVVNMKNMFGGNLTLTHGDWTARMSYGEADISFGLTPITMLGLGQAAQQASDGANQLFAGAQQASDAASALAQLDPAQSAQYAAQAEQLQAQGMEYAAQAAQVNFLLEELPKEAKTSITNIGVHGYLTDNISLMAEYVKIDSDHLVENDDEGFYVATTYDFQNGIRLTGTVSERQEYTLNSSAKDEISERMITVAYDYSDSILIKGELRRRKIDSFSNGALSGVNERDSLTVSLNYMF